MRKCHLVEIGSIMENVALWIHKYDDVYDKCKCMITDDPLLLM
jgi:hypothetical protein